MPEHAEPAHDAPPATDRVPAAGPGSLGELLGLGGPATPGVVLASQERVGNRATTEWLQRSVLDDVLPAGLADATRESRLLAAATFINNPVHYKLTMHYGYNNGALFTLTADDLALSNVRFDILSWPEMAPHLKDADAEYLGRCGDPDREAAGLPRVPRPDVEPARRHVAMGIKAIANGSLANCTANIDGELRVGFGGAEFEGTVRITDEWDFDTKIMKTIEGTSGRTAIGELETVAGALFLPGTPFLVDSVAVPVVQKAGDSKATLRV